ncbi:hypothetical protein E2C01_017468 [Portunus trituberculatus]|uniref:Uncharacterized protein n=1 Tax=Portunus trituberculatus TaxID=210409 RepID=A0A5B7DTJ4_PORTR|nr:hypothetical protein [Portunus trituberculatus]
MTVNNIKSHEIGQTNMCYVDLGTKVYESEAELVMACRQQRRGTCGECDAGNRSVRQGKETKT